MEGAVTEARDDVAVLALATTRGRMLAKLKWVVVLALLLPALAYAAVAFMLYRMAFEGARVSLDRAARVGQEQALKLFDTNEMLLQRMLDLIADERDEALLARSAELHEQLARMASELPQVQGLYVIGADARLLASSRAHPPPRNVDFSDRSWFQAYKNSDVSSFFTEQLVSRLTGEAAFDMSRRRLYRDGSAAGTVHVSLRPQYFTDFYKELGQTQPGLRMAVVRQDGALVARWPAQTPPDPAMAADPALWQTGDGRAASLKDGTVGLRHFRKLRNYPLYVIATIDRDVVIAEWRRQVTVLALFVFPTAIGFAWMAWVSLRHTRKEFDALHRLEDETARRQRAELALLQSQKLEAMGRLTGGVAHDFNNLLAVVGSSLEVLRRLKPELASTPQVGAIDRAVTSGTKLTRQLLAFARKQALLPERVLLQERLPNLAELLRPLLGSGIKLRWSVAEDTGAIHVDTAELELALINVAVNAADAMEARGELTIAARNAAAFELPAALRGDFVLIDVDDNGPGIAPGLAERVFEPFFTTKPVGKGTGLGLSQVRALCQATGGDARVDAAPGGGTRVRFLLKRSSAAAEPATAALPAQRALDARLLLVEDNDEVAHAMQQLLEAMGCRVQRASDGDEALEAVSKRRSTIDLVLSDIEMPGSLDGIALASRLREAEPTLPIVLMTGYAARLEQAVQLRQEVLPKPCSPAMLGEAIQRALVRRVQAPVSQAQ